MAAIDPRKWKTGNALESNDARDLDDNARILDVVLTDTTGNPVLDRLGNQRLTLKGIEALAAATVSQISDPLATDGGETSFTFSGFNASLSVYYVESVAGDDEINYRLRLNKHYTVADETTETIELIDGLTYPDGCVIYATSLDPTGTGTLIESNSNQFTSFTELEASTGLREGELYTVVSVGAKFIANPSGTSTSTGDRTNASNQVLTLQALDDGSWCVTHFIDDDASGTLNSYFSQASSRASNNSFAVTVPNTRDYTMDPNTSLTPAAIWIIGGAIGLTGLPTLTPNGLYDLSIFTGNVIMHLNEEDGAILRLGDGSQTYQQVTGEDGAAGVISAESPTGALAGSFMASSSKNEDTTANEKTASLETKAVNNNTTTGHTTTGLKNSAIHSNSSAQGNTYAVKNNIAAATGVTSNSILPYTTESLSSKNIVGTVDSVGKTGYTGTVSAINMWSRDGTTANARRGLVVKSGAVVNGQYLAEIFALPDNSGISWYDSNNSMGAYLKFLDSSDENQLRIGILNSTHDAVKVFTLGYDRITYGVGTSDIGESTSRFKTIYCVNSLDVSSDETLKEQRGALTDAEKEAALAIARLPKMFKWLSEIEQKADTDKTVYLHCSPMAQQVFAAFEDAGLDPSIYGMMSNGDNYSIVPQELLWMICAAQQEKIDEFESRITALETN